MRGRYRSLVARTGEVIENPAARMRLRFLRTGADTNGELLGRARAAAWAAALSAAV